MKTLPKFNIKTVMNVPLAKRKRYRKETIRFINNIKKFV
jgi:hypothetical protein